MVESEVNDILQCTSLSDSFRFPFNSLFTLRMEPTFMHINVFCIFLDSNFFVRVIWLFLFYPRCFHILFKFFW